MTRREAAAEAPLAKPQPSPEYPQPRMRKTKILANLLNFGSIVSSLLPELSVFPLALLSISLQLLQI